MARKKDTRSDVVKAVRKAVGKGRSTKGDAKAGASAKAGDEARAADKSAKTKRSGKVAAPVKARKAAPTVNRTAVAAVTSAPKKAKEAAKASALQSAREQAASLLPDLSVPQSLQSVPGQIGDAVKTLGGQIASALQTDVGRQMVAQLLISVAHQLTAAAEKAPAPGDVRASVLNAGAKIGAAAADAGAKLMEPAAPAAGTPSAGGTKSAAIDTRDFVRTMAQVAVGAATEVVAEVAQKAIARRAARASEDAEKAPGRKPPSKPR